MKTNLRWLKSGLLVLALAAISAAAQDAQYEPNPSHQNDALVQSYNLDRSISAMQHSGPARQNTAEEALQKLRQQTSPQHEYGWDWASTISAVIVIGLVIAVVTLFRPERRRVGPGEIRRAA
ncbi:MAG TPA: hypothetical protein VJA94_08170 [Candidatus Angelobacter sp.]